MNLLGGLILSLVLGSAIALYPQNSDVVKLTTDNFNDLVVNSDKFWVVKFYASWCVHSQNAVPEFSKVATALKGVAKVGAVDIDESKDLKTKYKIKRYPTILFFGANKKAPTKYKGRRTKKDIVNATREAIAYQDRKAVLKMRAVNAGSQYINKTRSGGRP